MDWIGFFKHGIELVKAKTPILVKIILVGLGTYARQAWKREVCVSLFDRFEIRIMYLLGYLDRYIERHIGRSPP